MSILIKSMEMPTSCYVCPFCDYVSARCDAVKGNPYTPTDRYEKRADFCPLVPVPPHGRLGDLDRMLADNEIYYNQLGRPDGEIGARYQSVKRSIELAPTIIPASFENPTKNARYSQDNPAEEGE